MARSIDEIYEQFGQDVAQVVRREIALHGNLIPLLQRFSLHTPADLNSQHVTLKNFIFQYGVAFFMAAMRPGLSNQEIERRRVDKLVHEIARIPRNKRQPTGQGQRQPTKRPTTKASDQKHANSGAAPPRASAAAPTKQQPVKAVDGRRIITTADYTGPDRRRGNDRRKSTRDRRSDLNIVFKNRRFGGRDRRKVVRREEDRLKLKK